MKSVIYPSVKFSDIARTFWRGIRPYQWLLFLLVLYVIAISGIGALVPLFYKQFFDVIAQGGGMQSAAPKLVEIIMKVAIFHAVLWLVYRLYAFTNNKFQAYSMARLKQQAYDYMMEHSYSFFASNFAGAMVQRVNRFARAFERLADRIIWDMLSLAIKITMVFVVLLFIHPAMAVAVLAWALVFLAFNVLFSRWKIKYDIMVAESDSKSTAYLADTIANHNTVQLFDKIRFESKGYKEATNRQAKITKFNWDLLAFMEAIQSILGFSIEFVLFYVAIRYWQAGIVTVGFFVLLHAYVISLIDQMWNFTRIIRDIYQSYADAKEMVEIMLLPHEIKDTPSAVPLSLPSGKIEFQNVAFSFHATRRVLEGITLNIRSGEKIALVGPSGAGKTTLVRLLLRLYVPTSGKILIGGQNIAKVTQGSLRKNIAMVPQDPILFHRTLAENIRYDNPGTSEEEVEKAVRLAHCDEFIRNLPYGLQTYVGERGIKLSGGERQRIAIARAILKNAPILILDEATSSLDSHSELMIQDALHTLMRGRTTIIIAHRLSTIQKMDRIIVVDKGQIVEEGSHRQLLSASAILYRKLWTLQAGGFLFNSEDEKEEGETFEGEPQLPPEGEEDGK